MIKNKKVQVICILFLIFFTTGLVITPISILNPNSILKNIDIYTSCEEEPVVSSVEPEELIYRLSIGPNRESIMYFRFNDLVENISDPPEDLLLRIYANTSVFGVSPESPEQEPSWIQLTTDQWKSLGYQNESKILLAQSNYTIDTPTDVGILRSLLYLNYSNPYSLNDTYYESATVQGFNVFAFENGLILNKTESSTKKELIQIMVDPTTGITTDFLYYNSSNGAPSLSNYMDLHLIGDQFDFNVYLESVADVRWIYQPGQSLIYSCITTETKILQYEVSGYKQGWYQLDLSSLVVSSSPFKSVIPCIPVEFVYAFCSEWDENNIKWVFQTGSIVGHMRQPSDEVIIGIGNKEGIFPVKYTHLPLLVPVEFSINTLTPNLPILTDIYEMNYQESDSTLFNILFAITSFSLQAEFDYNNGQFYLKFAFAYPYRVMTDVSSRTVDINTLLPLEYNLTMISIINLPKYTIPDMKFSTIQSQNGYSIIFKHPVDYSQKIYEYDWDFGDGSHIVTYSALDLTHTYKNPGTYEVTLKVVYSCGEYLVLKQIVTVNRTTTELFFIITGITASIVIILMLFQKYRILDILLKKIVDLKKVPEKRKQGLNNGN